MAQANTASADVLAPPSPPAFPQGQNSQLSVPNYPSPVAPYEQPWYPAEQSDSSWQTDQSVWQEQQWSQPSFSQGYGQDHWTGQWPGWSEQYQTPVTTHQQCGYVEHSVSYSLGAGYGGIIPCQDQSLLGKKDLAGGSNAPIDIRTSPIHVILDLGCTRAMGSRLAINALIAAAPHYNMWTELLPSKGTFSFANSQTSQVRQKCRVWFPTADEPIWTDFDIVEEGSVPLLMSLAQMKNLQMTLHLDEDKPHMVSPVLGNIIVPLQKSTSRHLVFDLRTLMRAHPRKLQSDGFNSPSFYQEGQVNPGNLANAAFGTQTVYKKRQGIPGHPCPACAGQHRPHTKVAPCKFAPAPGGGEDQPPVAAPAAEPKVPKPKAKKEPVAQDSIPDAAPSGQPAGRDLLEPSAAPEPEQPAQEGEVPPVPEAPQGVYMPAELRKLHERLNSDVGLHKLHIRHYRMSLRRFRARTPELALPEEIYQRYEKVVKHASSVAKQPRFTLVARWPAFEHVTSEM